MRLSLLTIFFIIFHIAAPAYAQDCTGPNGVKGDMMFNNTFDVFQGCTARGWMALHQPVSDPCVISGAPGTVCADGQTVYAGSWNGGRYYTTVADQSASARYGAFGATLGVNAQSPTDGLTNTNTALAYFAANPQTGGCSTPYNPPACTPNAHILCQDLRTTLGGDWYLPAPDEIVNVLYANNVAIGGFSNAYYWSSTEFNSGGAQAVSLSSGAVANYTKGNLTLVRCVRRG